MIIDESDVRQRIIDDWEGTNSLSVALFIFEYLINSYQFSYDDPIRIENLSPSKEIDDEELNNILFVVNYFSHPHIGLIKVRYELFDGYNIYELDADELYEGKKSGFIIHPVTGRKIEEYEGSVSLSFVLNPELEIRGEQLA